MIKALLLRVLIDPRLASHVGAMLAGHPELGAVLERVCERESDCTPIGVHRHDARWSEFAWRVGVGSGRLDPSCQHPHGGWATRGAWGTWASATVVHVGIRCLPAWVIDIPLVGAFVGAFAAARRAAHPDCDRYAACRRWRGAW